MTLSLLFSLSELSAPGATWEENEREMSFFFRDCALQRRARRLQILDDANIGLTEIGCFGGSLEKSGSLQALELDFPNAKNFFFKLRVDFWHDRTALSL